MLSLVHEALAEYINKFLQIVSYLDAQQNPTTSRIQTCHVLQVQVQEQESKHKL